MKTDWRPLSARESDDDEDDLEISDVHYSSTDTTIVVKWETNRDADGSIRWGLDKNNLNERKEENDEKGEDHKITIRELQPNTEYYFRVKSADGGNSDTSRTYLTSTKAPSALFARRIWQSLPKDGTDQEQLKIEISDEKEKTKEEAEKAEKMEEAEKPSFFENAVGFLEVIYDKLTEGVKNIALGIRETFLAFQEKIQERAEKIAGLIGEEKRNLEFKAPSEETVKSIERFFATEIYKKDSAKRIAEIRFQILDKKNVAIPNLETKLFSEPRVSVTDENGIVSFRDVEIGEHTLAFNHEEKEFRKKVAIADTLTEEGGIVAEVVQIKAEKDKLAWWMRAVIILLILAIAFMIYFAEKYYKLKNKNFS